MSMRDLKSNISPAVSVPPAANRTATVAGAGVDLKGFDSAAAVVHFGAITDGGWTPSLTESDTGAFGGEETAVAAADLVGAFTEAVAANDDTVQTVGYIGTKRHIQVVVTESTASTTGAIFSANVVRGHPHLAPTA